ncbi:MAG: DUF3261 domain-containing protein [Cellvibrio sp.]|uniref:DUF3261 domain-containing protein n=1 Tax=Cellvibrio sp. TaxID=1965322 RepID=UPI0031A3D796
MSRLIVSGAIALLVLITSGCVSRQVQTLADLPLPATPASNCCWQALQQLHINYQQQNYQLTGALAQTRAGITLVLLDPLGRRLLSVQKQGDALQTWRSPELPEGLPERFLLASSMLVWWPLADWQTALRATPDWQVTSTAKTRVLSHRGRPIIGASYGPAPVSVVEGMTQKSVGQAEVVVLQHQLQPMTITIATERLEPVQ